MREHVKITCKSAFIIKVLISAFIITINARFAKLPRIISWIESKKSDFHFDERHLDEMTGIIDKIARFRFFLIRNNCFKKSLLLYYWLVKLGVKGVEIKFGVAMEGEKLTGHSWVTRDGSVFLDSPESILGYSVTYTSGVLKNE